MFRKGLILAVIVLFFGAGVTPIISGNSEPYNKDESSAIEGSTINTSDEWVEQEKLLALDGEFLDVFGFSVIIYDDNAFIGSFYDDNKNGVDAGSIYVFKRNNTTWTWQTKILALDGADEDYFGYSMSIDDNYAIIGATNDDDNGNDSGSAYIFKHDGTNWIQQQKLLASDGAEDDSFGWSVSIDGDYAIVGAPYDDNIVNRSGSAYIFKRNGTNWIQQQKLLASDKAEGDLFGRSVSIDGNYVVIGAQCHEGIAEQSGSAYMFKRNGSKWIQTQKLLALDGEKYDWFGCSVSIDGDYALIGAEGNEGNGNDSGSAYIFKHDGTNWIQEQKLFELNGAAQDWFGCSVSIDKDNALIGAKGKCDNGLFSGSAYIFKRNGTSWIQQQKLLASDSTEGDHFGLSVSIYGDYLIVGAPFNDDNGIHSGSAYIFVKNQIVEPELEVTIKRGLRRSICVVIENTGSENVNDITWNLIVTRRGIIKRTILNKTGYISNLGTGSKEKIVKRTFGFGLIKVIVNVNALGIEPIEKTIKGFIFLRFIRLRRFL